MMCTDHKRDIVAFCARIYSNMVTSEFCLTTQNVLLLLLPLLFLIIHKAELVPKTSERGKPEEKPPI